MDAVKVGTRLTCRSCGTEVIVVKAPTGPLTCCGQDMDGPEDAQWSAMGKRYTCAECEGEVLCTKPGDGIPSCHGQEMGLKEAKPLPSSD